MDLALAVTGLLGGALPVGVCTVELPKVGYVGRGGVDLVDGEVTKTSDLRDGVLGGRMIREVAVLGVSSLEGVHTIRRGRSSHEA